MRVGGWQISFPFPAIRGRKQSWVSTLGTNAVSDSGNTFDQNPLPSVSRFFSKVLIVPIPFLVALIKLVLS
jgi:hypothetical protein